MKRRIRSVTAADDTKLSGLDDAIDTLKDDFDYLIAGLEKLGRTGINASNEGQAIVENLSTDIQSYLAQIAELVTE